MAAQIFGDLSLNGIAAAPSGSVRFYQPQTLTPITVYSNDAATTAVTQPVQLDATGKSVVPIYLTTPARMIVYNSAGAQLFDYERVDGNRAENDVLANALWPTTKSLDAMATNLALSLGGTDGAYKSSATGAAARSLQSKLTEFVSVKDFGAKGDGITDDTGAIVSALTAVPSGGGNVLFPAGTYLISQSIAIPQSNILLQGSGPTGSVIQNSSSTGGIFTMALGIVTVSFVNLGLTASTSSSGTAVSMVTGSGSSFISCAVTKHRTGVAVTNSSSGLFLLNTSITTDNNASSFCLSLTQTSTASMYGGSMSCGASTVVGGTCVSLPGGTGSFISIGTTYFGPLGVTTSGADVTMIGGAAGGLGISLGTLYTTTGGNPVITAIAPPLSTTFPANVSRSSVIAPPQGGAYGDSGPYLTTNVAVTSAYTVTNTIYRYHRVVGTAGGITITVTAPAANAAYQGSLHTVVCANNSGGAVTWAFSAAYRVAAVSPATGNQVAITFLCIDAVTPVFVEVDRGSVVAI